MIHVVKRTIIITCYASQKNVIDSEEKGFSICVNQMAVFFVLSHHFI